MFSISTPKLNPFDAYNQIQTQYLNIKNLNSFNTYTIIPTNDLITISNIVIDSVDKLSEISVFIIKKLNEQLSNNNLLLLQEIFKYHNNLLNKIYDFNKISYDISEEMKNIFSLKLTPDVINFIHYDIINRYKLIIVQILNYIKELNIYVNLIKF